MTDVEGYISYWGLTRHPFLLAPDSTMMYVAGQYFECLERLKYAINTNKGGALLVSEDAGLGKTTVLLKLVDELKALYGDAFRYAIVDHPTLSPAQIIAHIAGAITGLEAHGDKLKNLTMIREYLIDVHRQGGKSVIIVDEGQMLCGAPDVLQELRVLINLTYESEYLHTFILSGQRALWNAIKAIPEFWQRLPVRYYLLPLELEDTRGIIRHRLGKAGMEEGREIFTDDALQIIHRYSRGSPRTILALADLSLLVGFSNRTDRVTFKEVSKAMNAMSGRGESLPYVTGETQAAAGAPGVKPPKPVTVTLPPEDVASQEKEPPGVMANRVPSPRMEMGAKRSGGFPMRRWAVKGLIGLILLGGTVSYSYLAGFLFIKDDAKGHKAPTEQIGTALPHEKVPPKDHAAPVTVPPEPSAHRGSEPAPVPAKAVEPEALGAGREIVVSVRRGNLRASPGLDAPVVGGAEKGDRFSTAGEPEAADGMLWYRIVLDGKREAWIAEAIAVVPKPRESR